jgi:hypothetical protein
MSLEAHTEPVVSATPPSSATAEVFRARPIVPPYSFGDLLDGRADLYELSNIFHLHIPKAGGGSLHILLRQNNFGVMDFDMNTKSFFGLVDELEWMKIQLQPFPRRRFGLSGHYRMDAGLLKTMRVPHVIITTLRDPIKRVLSHYNFTLLVPGNPYRDELLAGKMSLLEYAEWLAAPNAVGPQYSFFDDTGDGSFARTGTAPVGHCLRNLLEKVGVHGFTDRFDEFCVLFGYLLRRPHIAIRVANETSAHDDGEIELKSSVNDDERGKLEKMYGDDIWFYRQARDEYERRLKDVRLKSVIADALPHIKIARRAMQTLNDMADPANSDRSAFRIHPAPPRHSTNPA